MMWLEHFHFWLLEFSTLYFETGLLMRFSNSSKGLLSAHLDICLSYLTGGCWHSFISYAMCCWSCDFVVLRFHPSMANSNLSFTNLLTILLNQAYFVDFKLYDYPWWRSCLLIRSVRWYTTWIKFIRLIHPC